MECCGTALSRRKKTIQSTFSTNDYIAMKHTLLCLEGNCSLKNILQEASYLQLGHTGQHNQSRRFRGWFRWRQNHSNCTEANAFEAKTANIALSVASAVVKNAAAPNSSSYTKIFKVLANFFLKKISLIVLHKTMPRFWNKIDEWWS